MASKVRSRIVALVASVIALTAAVVVPTVVPNAVSAESTVANVTVHDAAVVEFAPGVQTSPPRATNSTVSCPADGECVAFGIGDVAGPQRQYRGFVTVQRGGVWGRAQLLEFPGSPSYTYDSPYVNGFECTAVGECDGTGFFDDGSQGNTGGFHFRVSGGVVQPATWLTYSGTGITAMYGRSIACTAPGDCTILGWANPLSGGIIAVDWVVSGGVAAPGAAVSLPPSLVDPVAPSSQGLDIECPSAGACVELGWAGIGGPTAGQLWVRVQSDGSWGAAQTLAFDPSAVSQTEGSTLGILECWAVGECAIAGQVPLVATGGAQRLFAAAIGAGTLGLPSLLGTPAGYPATARYYVRSFECPGVANCVGVVQSWDPAASTGLDASRISMIDGVWSTPVPFTSPVSGRAVNPSSLGCIAVGSCVAAGAVFETVAGVETAKAFLFVQRDGVWHDAIQITAVIDGENPSLDIFSVRCVRGGRTCSAVGGAGEARLGLTELAPSSVNEPMVPQGSGYAVTQLTEFNTPATPKFTG